jgi:hypothetical protein
VHRLARLVEAAGEELVLAIGRGEPLAGLGEQADRRRPHHQRAAAAENVFEAGLRLAYPAARDLVQRVGAARLIDDAAAEMVLQIVADPRQFVHQRDAMLAQEFARTDTGKLQQLRRQ